MMPDDQLQMSPTISQGFSYGQLSSLGDVQHLYGSLAHDFHTTFNSAGSTGSYSKVESSIHTADSWAL